MTSAFAIDPKPDVVALGGAGMGSGAGSLIHAPVRVVACKQLFATPETWIGLIADTGAMRGPLRSWTALPERLTHGFG